MQHYNDPAEFCDDDDLTVCICICTLSNRHHCRILRFEDEARTCECCSLRILEDDVMDLRCEDKVKDLRFKHNNVDKDL